MGQELAVPAAFQQKAMAGAFAAKLNAQDDNLSEGIGQSYGVVAYKGKTWSIRHRGERKAVIRPDDGTPSAYLDVIVLGQAKSKSKSFYKKYDPGTSDGERPICSSIDGVVPDADVTTKQCDSCALCPRNVWKTDPQTGRKGRECTDYKRLAVLVLPTQTKPIFGQPLMEPIFLRVPPDSLNSLAIMGETMANQGFHYSSYITRITFDPQKAHPCMVFRPLQPLSDQEAGVILDLREDAIVGRITGGDVALGSMKAVEQALAPAGTNATGLTAPAQTRQAPLNPVSGVVASSVVQTTPPAGSSSTGLGDARPATPQPEPETQAQTMSTGLTAEADLGSFASGGATAAVTQSAPSQVDAGAPEATDDELDAQIASLIGAK